MKKTIVAAAIAAAVAAPAAFADVSVSGFIVQEFVTDSNDAASSKDGLESNSDVGLTFKASEDLGNGLSAFAQITTNSDDGAAVGSSDQKIGLKGDFGTLVIGRMETLTESVTMSKMNMDSSDNHSVEPFGDYDSATADGAIAYVSPTMNGLHFAVACVAVDGNDSTNQNGDANCDGTDVLVNYAANGLDVTLSRESLNGHALNALSLGTATTQVLDQDTTGLTISYQMGDTKFILGRGEVENALSVSGDHAEATVFGVKHSMGANTISVGYLDEDYGDKSDGTYNKTTQKTIVDLNHALSKRTSAFISYQNTDVSGGANVTASDKDAVAIGMKHTF
jgi:predicted porin